MFTIPNGAAIANGSRQPAMPGLPAPDPAAWYADDMKKKSEDIYYVSENQ